MVDGKRKKLMDADDTLLPKQITADEPYKGGYGKDMESTHSTDLECHHLATIGSPESARSNNKKAAKSSGITEEYELKHELLDEVLLLVDERRYTQANDKEGARTKALAAEKTGESPNKFAKLAEVLREHKEKKLELRREQWEQERQVRLAAEAQRREDQQHLMQVLTLLVVKK
ncbi:hypothetical protein PF005_g6428 [Phytophthora fragariae]|uniref:Uncharacterized protein n=1 Tax=Phytophthora fragariae TaxID=53985 RepID=A0A6A3FH38_9STRA|nr:hypothetical protein PF009_g6949 [Phytophthora fragariae]KAE9019501.1 hypothetical protein PF011_g5804 [Phytophthora fragariae]KAE9125974.1 hypothetical protein PF010_g5427 [Phytophthora fragariae]KAE9223117.1 hypothetical protein PF005_g6428 [Phytophthora fragariae]KAE9310764.1 hypothetical protein PF001_g10046 [Phytophthora fragariae]